MYVHVPCRQAIIHVHVHVDLSSLYSVNNNEPYNYHTHTHTHTHMYPHTHVNKQVDQIRQVVDSELGYDSATTPNTGQFKVHYIYMYMYMYNIIVKRFHRNHNHVKMSAKQSAQILYTCILYFG